MTRMSVTENALPVIIQRRLHMEGAKNMTKYICPNRKCAKIWGTNGVCNRQCSSVLNARPPLPPVKWAKLLSSNYANEKCKLTKNLRKKDPPKIPAKGNKRGRAVIAIDDKGKRKTYPSIMVASRELGINPKTISNCLAGLQKKTKHGLTWQYADHE